MRFNLVEPSFSLWDYYVNECIPYVFMLKAAIDLNHFYGRMVFNQVVRFIRGGFTLLDIFDKKREHQLHEKKSIE